MELKRICQKISCWDEIVSAQQKKELYALIQKAAGDFRNENGSIICRELLGLEEKNSSPVPEERTKEYYKKRPCAELCALAGEITEKLIKKYK